MIFLDIYNYKVWFLFIFVVIFKLGDNRYMIFIELGIIEVLIS